MKLLSALDAAFLYLESPQMPMHVGALHVLELPAGRKGRFVTALRAHVERRLPLAPVLRRCLARMPLDLASPAWVDAEPDLDAHIVEIRLTATERLVGGMAAIEACVGRLHAVPLSRDHPLWKMHVIEGLPPAAGGARRVALYTQLHHAAVDGQAAVALASVLFDLSADAPPPKLVPSGRPKVFQLGPIALLRGALSKEVSQLAGLVKALPGALGTLAEAARQALAGPGREWRGALKTAPRTPLNVSVGEGRVFATASVPLDALKAFGRPHGATVNDLVLMLVGSALRAHYAGRHLPPRRSMVAAVPVSLRAKGDQSANTQASMSLMSLGTHIADPLRRLRHILQSTRAMKSAISSVKGLLPTDLPSIGLPWLLEAGAALYGKAGLAERLPPLANLVVSNVPGPTVPLYLAGARMRSNHPTSIVVHGMALNITVQSYNQSLDFGLMADASAMPDVRDLADAIVQAFEQLRSRGLPTRAARKASPPTGATPKPRKRAASGAVAKVTRKAAAAPRPRAPTRRRRSR